MAAEDDDGYRLWLRYPPIAEPARRDGLRAALTRIVLPASSPMLAAARDELARGLAGLLGEAPPFVDEFGGSRAGTNIGGGCLVAGTPETSPTIAVLDASELPAEGEGFVVRCQGTGADAMTVIAARGERGVLYGVFALLRHLQTGRPLEGLNLRQQPRFALRMLNHWDNLDGTVERGYAGRSLWQWDQLPGTVSPRMRDYARANASIGINAVALTNVNADARVLTAPYLRKVAALANAFRPYGMRVWLTARFSAPIEIGGLRTADPLAPEVAAWWRGTCGEILRHVPDFGGFLVKANSEGQPGPRDYGRTHADGANLLADALAAATPASVKPADRPGTIWRAFVYQPDVREDRAKQAFSELAPLDGAFHDNAFVQVKNGPIDFQPREPFHPLFGAMPRTRLLVEFQITQEYLGQGTHLVYLAPLFAETLEADTGRTPACVGAIVRGMAGVANIGDARNWCGHPFAAANWFAFGRLAWDGAASADGIADEWLRMTFSNDARFVEPAKRMMLGSRAAAVDYMTPLGLHHIMAEHHHHGPGPWVNVDAGKRPDWTSVYYHRADAKGIGFDRTATGSNAVAQYASAVGARFGNPGTCPEELLLWFHHLSWGRRMKSGRTLWDELCLRYQRGVNTVRAMRETWRGLAPYVDGVRFAEVEKLLGIQEGEAITWRDACVQYFQTFAKRPVPAGVEHPARALKELRDAERGPRQ